MLCQGCGNPLQESSTCSWVSFAGFDFFLQQDKVERKAKGKTGGYSLVGLQRDAEQQDLNRHLVVMG